MHTVTPIGSCRILGPLKQATQFFPIELNSKRAYGYCHSSLEAVQQLRFLQGDYHPPEDLWPLMSRGLCLNDAKREYHEPSDCYVLELSSQKHLTVRGHAVQLNYLQKRYSDFFNDRPRSDAFWSAVNKGSTEAWLNENWGGNNRKSDRFVLKDLSLRLATLSEIQTHLEELKERLDNLLVVSHMDVTLPDGGKILSRSRYVEMVEQACRNLGIICYNPTELISVFGQSHAIKEEGASYTHYQKDFEQVLAKDLVLGPLSDLCGTVFGRNPSCEFSQLEQARSAEFNGKKAEAMDLAQQIFMRGPSIGRAHWVAKLTKRFNATLSDEVLNELSDILGVSRTIGIASNDRQRTSLLRKVQSEREVADVASVLIEHQSSLSEILGFLEARPLKKFPNALSASLCEAISALPVFDEQMAHWIRLLRIAPNDVTVLKHVRILRKSVVKTARLAFKDRDDGALFALLDQTAGTAIFVDEVAVLACRRKIETGQLKTALALAENLVEQNPGHLTSWILLMRSADHLGVETQRERAAKHVHALAQDRSPKHVREAEKHLVHAS